MNAERRRAGREVPADAGLLAARLEQLCSGCDGTGVLVSEAWEEWDRRRTRLHLRRAGAEGALVLADLLDAALTKHEQCRPAGPRQTACEDCAGAGTVPTAEGVELLAFLRRHLTRK